jgi:hypothetical protein
MMRPFILSSAGLTLLLALAAPAQANPEPLDGEEKNEQPREGGNAIDKATGAGTERPMTGMGSLPPEAYAIIGDFLAAVASGDGWAAVEVIDEAWKQPPDASLTFGYLAPVDGPAESVLDQIDESRTPLPMVGEAGSEVTVAAPEPTPPPESILDFIDQPTPAPAGTQDAAKPAANQAPRPAVAPSPPPP